MLNIESGAYGTHTHTLDDDDGIDDDDDLYSTVQFTP